MTTLIEKLADIIDAYFVPIEMLCISYLFGILPLWFAGVFLLGLTFGRRSQK